MRLRPSNSDMAETNIFLITACPCPIASRAITKEWDAETILPLLGAPPQDQPGAPSKLHIAIRTEPNPRSILGTILRQKRRQFNAKQGIHK
jgi:hypothetical protein